MQNDTLTIFPNDHGVKWHDDVVLHVTEAQYFDAWSTTRLHLEMSIIYICTSRV